MNKLQTEFLGIHALNFAAPYVSPSRAVMFASHFSQRLQIDGCDEKRVQTGMEQEMSKYTFSVKMPENGRIIKVIHRYPRTIGHNSIEFNPETLVIYENDDTKEIDYFSIANHASYHQFFGFKYSHKETINQIKPGAYIAKDIIFADSPSVSENNGFMYGVNMNVAFMSIPSVSEDGVMISRDALDKFKFRVYETRIVEFGANQFPLNYYGTKDYYKPFPDIGEYIKDEGAIMMLREYDNDISPVDMSIYDVMEPDYSFDKGVYARGKGGKVVDIKIIKNNSSNRQIAESMCPHIDKYSNALLKFHQEIVNTELAIRLEHKKKYGENKLALSTKLQRLMVESLAIINHNAIKTKQNLQLLYRKTPIDEYRIEFTLEYEMKPGLGFKISNTYGGKCVICKIEEPENMPVDNDGNRADMVMDSNSIGARMNIGTLYETYFTAAARDTSKQIRKILGVDKADINTLLAMPEALVNTAYEYLLNFYAIVSPRQHQFFSNEVSNDEVLEHLVDIVNKGIYIYYPIENQINIVEAVKSLEKYYKPTYGPVTYVGDSGNKITTVENIRISEMYVMLLEKIADDWSSVAIGNLQHFGILAPMIKSEKHLYPFRNSPVRTIGETEFRIFDGYCGVEAMAEMMDRSSSPTTQRHINWNILSSDKPTNIERIVDRQLVPLGATRPLQLCKHIMKVSGFAPVYKKEK